MKVHPQVTQQNGIVNVSILAEFVGDATDATDRQRIQAYGDPKVNLGGTYTDPSNTGFTFTFPAQEFYVGITTQMSAVTARFMQNLPAVPQPVPGQYPSQFSVCQYPGWAAQPPQPPQPGPLDCLTTNPVEAATVWAAAIQTAVQAAMTALRAQTPAQLTTLPDETV